MGKRSDVFFAALIGIVLFIPVSFSAQQTDPFYISLLEKAQKSFLARNYQDAARDFEIAAFGLTENKSLQAKAKVYIGLCRYYLNDLQGSEKSLREAADLMGDQGFASLEIYESVWPDLDKLISFFDLARPQVLPLDKEVEKPPTNTEPPEVNPGEPPKKPQEKQGPDAAKEAETRPATDPPASVNFNEIKEGDLMPLNLVEKRPVLIKSAPAVYPEYARPLRIEGTVLINALISEKGDVIETEIIRGIENAVGFDQAALRAVRQWKFEPAVVKGLNVKVWLRVAIEFKRPQTPSE